MGIKVEDGIKWGPVGKAVYERTYSRRKPDGSKETWAETVDRVVDGNLSLVDKKFWRRNERQDLIDLLYNFKALPAGRHLWVSGVKGRQFLFNCFGGKTKVHTDSGVFLIKDLVGKQVNVLSQGGKYRVADIREFGKQELWKITFSDQSQILATKNHRWSVNKRKSPITTDKLAGHDIPFVCAPKPEKNDEYIEGLMHGFVFGDGTKSGNKTCVQMFGAASDGMSKVFNENGYKTSNPEYCESYVGKLPGHWKELPYVESVSKSYLYGFFMGLLAADGHVDSRGSVYFYQSDKRVLEYINEIAPLVGLLPTDNIKTHREKSPFDGSDKPLYTLNIRRMSIDPGCLVNTIHKNNWSNAAKVKNKALRVISVEPTGKIKRTYCAVEKETETFVVGQGLLTKNCHVAGWREKLSDHYSFVFDELMKGGGVGANYSDRFIKKYPAIKNQLDVHIVCDPEHNDYEKLKSHLSSNYSHKWDGCIPVDDSREGWVDALVLLIDQAFSGRTQPIVFDVSRIRPYGALIRSFGGTASGPSALVRMLLEIADLLSSRIGKKLTSLDHMEMDHRIAMCVVAGNVRRSARMSIKHWKDPDIFEFIKCKNDDARVAHWTTNISVAVDNAFFRAFKSGDTHAVALYTACIASMHKGGEPGFCNMSLAQHGEIEEVVSSNPCGEIFLLPFGNCNLGHVNLGHFFDDIEGAKRAFMMMTRFLIRATFGDIASDWQQAVVKKNRRIGVGFFGFQDWLCKQGKKYSECHNDQDVQQSLRLFYRVVKKTAMEYAHQLRIPAPIKNTALAPTGSIAKLPGATEGAQALLFPFYEQRMRHEQNDPKIPELMMQGVEFEKCINKQEAVNTIIAKHICKHPLVDEVTKLGYDAEEIVEGQNDISIHDTLAVQAMLQREWADNAISLTVNLSPDITEKELYHTIIKFLPKLKGTTVLVGVGGRPQPPYTKISREEYEAYEGRKIIMDTKGQCSNGVCPVK